MKAIILAAGRGSRMKTLTDSQPKCLIQINGKTLLDMQLDTFKKIGINEIGIVTGYKNELLKNKGLMEFHNSKWSETNMVYSLFCAESWLKEDQCIISYSDIFYNSDALDTLIQSNSDIAITYDLNWLKLWSKRFQNPLVDAETLRLTEDGYIEEIGFKSKSIEEIQGQYMGILYFTPKGWEEISRIWISLSRNEQNTLQMTAMLQMVINNKKLRIKAMSYEGEWGEIDSTEDLLIYQKY
jgi:choline kinase